MEHHAHTVVVDFDEKGALSKVTYQLRKGDKVTDSTGRLELASGSLGTEGNGAYLVHGDTTIRVSRDGEVVLDPGGPGPGAPPPPGSGPGAPPTPIKPPLGPYSLTFKMA
jgi:hypothetical protein